MIDYNKEYFFICADSNPNYPLLTLESSDEDYAMKLLSRNIVDYNNHIRLKFQFPIPKKPELADHHVMQGSVFSEKVKNVFKEFPLKNVQLIPATIRDKNKNIFKNYYILHVYHLISCVDLEKSRYRKTASGRLLNFEKIILDSDIIDKIPLEDRLIFTLSEKNTYVLYHKSVIEKILQVSPTGLTTYQILEWDPYISFKEEYNAYLKEIKK